MLKGNNTLQKLVKHIHCRLLFKRLGSVRYFFPFFDQNLCFYWARTHQMRSKKKLIIRVQIFITLKNISISNKCCSFKCFAQKLYRSHSTLDWAAQPFSSNYYKNTCFLSTKPAKINFLLNSNNSLFHNIFLPIFFIKIKKECELKTLKINNQSIILINPTFLNGTVMAMLSWDFT